MFLSKGTVVTENWLKNMVNVLNTDEPIEMVSPVLILTIGNKRYMIAILIFRTLTNLHEH